MIKAGSVQDKMALNLDYGATFLDLAGIAIPEEVQGESLLPLMANNYTDWRKSIYYHYYEYPGWHLVRKHYGVRTETHKLMKFYGDDIWDYEMYDLVNDPHELINIAGLPQYKDLQDSLNTELQRLIKYYKDDTVEIPTKLSEMYGEDYREQWTKEKINYVM